MTDEQGRALPPWNGGESDTVHGFLDFFRATIEWKTAGLDAGQLFRQHPPSTMTLGGMLKHLTFVEDWWFSHVLLGESREPWVSVDWDADADWDWHSATDHQPDELRNLWRAAVERSRAASRGVELETRAATALRNGEHVSLRWILLHMVEEYARHCGHADLLREAVDGMTGE